MRLELVFPAYSLDGTHTPLYSALWAARKRDESMSDAALRVLKERLLPRPAPTKPLLEYVEVIDA